MNTLIIPAYNESANISRILQLVANMPDFYEVIVVDDGSMDHTAEVAASFGVKVIRLEQNQGKGGAIAAGLKASVTPFLTLLDADLIGLQRHHIRALAEPVLNGEAVMTMGIFASGRFHTDWAQKIAPSITGQRVIRREVLESLPDLRSSRFGVDLVLTKYAERMNLPVSTVLLHDVTQTMKEEKMGFVRGMAARLKMYWEIFRVMGK